MWQIVFIVNLLIFGSVSVADICYDLPGYTAHGTSCFKLYSISKTWADAEASCVADGGHLTSIHSSEEQAFIVNLAGSSTTYIGASGVPPDMSWSDNTDMDYDNWKPNVGGDGHQNCGMISPPSFQWTSRRCTMFHQYICRADKVIDQTQAFFTKIPNGAPVDAAAVCSSKHMVWSTIECAQRCQQDAQCVHFIMSEDGRNYRCETYTSMKRPPTATPPTENYQKII